MKFGFLFAVLYFVFMFYFDAFNYFIIFYYLLEVCKHFEESVFQDSTRVIGESFQPAITAPQQGFIGHGTTFAQG